MSNRLIRNALFGGAIFAAGVAHADTSFNFAVGPAAGYASAASVTVGSDNYAVTRAYAGSAPLSIFTIHDCGTDPYGYFHYESYGSAFVSAYGIDATAASIICDDARATVRAYFSVGTPTEFLIEWSNSYGYAFAAGVWEVPGVGPPALVAGPGVVNISTVGNNTFVLGAGLYFVDFDANSAAFSTARCDLRVLGDAPCPCDMDLNGSLNLDDIDAFVTAFLAGDLAADFDGSGSLNLDDIDAFVACFLAGCP